LREPIFFSEVLIQEDPNQTAIALELLGTSIRLLNGELTEEIVALKPFKVVKFSGAKPELTRERVEIVIVRWANPASPRRHQPPSGALLRRRSAECHGARLVAFDA